jgi:lysophospholipase L1-like esterase
VLLVLVILGEIGARVAIPPYKKRHPPASPSESMRRVFRYDSRLGWLPKADLNEAVPYPAATIRVSQNSEGFRESERDPADGRPEWSVLGDSQAWGYNVEAADRFSDRLGDRFPGKQFRNYGVSGFGTAQELLLYEYVVSDHEPEGVLLLYGSNDRSNNRKARTRAGYARPRYLVRGDELVLESREVPDLNPLQVIVPRVRSHLLDALRYRWERIQQSFDEDPTGRLIEELARKVRLDGRALVVAIENEDAEIVATCERLGVPVIELGPALARGNQRQPVEFPADKGRHWTPWGHRVAADAIAAWLQPQLP